MTLVRIQAFAVFFAAALFVGCFLLVVFTQGSPFADRATAQWIGTVTALSLAYASGQPKSSMFSTLAFGKYLPAIVGYWLLSVFWTANIILLTVEAYTRPQSGEFAGRNPVANLAVGCTLL
jgi:hypothetical protein